MRILILAQQWEPEEGTPQRRWAPLVETLVRQGHKVVVVAPPPHYPGGVLTCDDPAVQVGATAKGRHGEVVVRCNFSEHNQSLISRILDQGIVAISTLFTAQRIIKAKRPHIILTTAPPLPSVYVTYLVAKANKVPYVVDLRDVWPDLLQHMNEWGPQSDQKLEGKSFFAPTFTIASSLASKLFNRAIRHATGITTTTPSFAELLRQRGLENVLNVRNMSSILDSPASPIRTGDDVPLKILYIGTTGRAQGLHSALDAIDLLDTKGVAVEMRIVGSGASLNFLKKKAQNLDLPIQFLGRIPHDQVKEHYEWSDTSLVHLRGWEPLSYTVPSKLYESLSAGRHVTVAANGESARIVTKTGVGHAVCAMNPFELATLWEHLANNREELSVANTGLLWLKARESQFENAQKFANFVKRCTNETV